MSSATPPQSVYCVTGAREQRLLLLPVLIMAVIGLRLRRRGGLTCALCFCWEWGGMQLPLCNNVIKIKIVLYLIVFLLKKISKSVKFENETLGNTANPACIWRYAVSYCQSQSRQFVFVIRFIGLVGD